jgi:phage terminase large subunit-like protein
MPKFKLKVNPEELPPAEREEFERMMAELQASLEANPLQDYHPNPGQAPFHEAQTKIKALMGGNRSGKTTGGIVDDLIQAVDRDCLPSHLRPFKRWEPPTKIRIVAPKFNENVEQVIFPEIRRWVPRAQLRGGSWDGTGKKEGAFSKQRRVLSFENGSTIQFLTFDQDLDAHAGAGLHRVHFDEEPEGEKGVELYEENMARLADHNGDFVLTMTPLFGLSWSFDRIWERRHEPNITAIQVDTEQNMEHLNREAMEEFWASLPEEVRKARKEGRFVHFSGLFYDEFRDGLHIVDPPDEKRIKSQFVVVGIDPGLNRPGVVWIGFDSDNAAVVFDELCEPQTIVPELATKIHAKNKKWGIEPTYYVIDPSARNRNTVNGEQIQGAFQRAGIPTIYGQNDRAAGILEVKRRLQQKGLVVSRDCPTLIWEFSRYRKDSHSANEFDAVKENDDELDALRYALMSRPWNVRQTKPDEYEPWKPGTAPDHRWLDQLGTHTSPPLGAMS